jgi:hypothetical protein
VGLDAALKSLVKAVRPLCIYVACVGMFCSALVMR